MADETPKKQPTASEAMFFYAIVKHTKNKADIDWHAVATEQGFKSAEVAKVRFGQVKRKLGIDTATTPGSGGKAPSGKSGSGADGPALTTPTKVTKKTGRTGSRGKKPTMKKEEESQETNETMEDVKPSVEDDGAATKQEPLPESGYSIDSLLNF